MNVGINDNITALYQVQQAAINQNKLNDCAGSCAPANTTKAKTEPSKLEKIGAGVGSTLGVIGSLMLLAKLSKSKNYSINPLKMFTGNIKNSFIAETKYKTKEIVTIGAGSILGGLAGSFLGNIVCLITMAVSAAVIILTAVIRHKHKADSDTSEERESEGNDDPI